ATRADVPLSTTSYFFDSINDLVAEALREQRHEQIAAFDEAERTWILQDDEPSRELLAQIAQHLVDREAHEKAANAETYLAANRDPAVAETLIAVLTRFEERLAALSREPDAPVTDALTRNLLALVVGSTLQDLAGLSDPAA